MRILMIFILILVVSCNKKLPEEPIDPLGEILSQYELKTLKIWWSINPRRRDTTIITETIYLTKEKEGIRIQHGGGSIDRYCPYTGYYEGMYWYITPSSGSNGSVVSIDLLNREVELESTLGGLGSGFVYATKFKY